MPNGQYFGDDQFTYTVTDGLKTATATVFVEVRPTPCDYDCDDGNLCTQDNCDGFGGCVNDGTDITLDCDDANAAPLEKSVKVMQQAPVAEEQTLTCIDDGNPCTAESCDPVNGCSSDGTGVTIACDDGNACTTGEICLGDADGTCGEGTTVVCADDDNPCTVESCDPINGCSSDGTGITIARDDADACTAGETCLGDADGTCGEGTTVVCADDGNPCTVESCDPINGCLHDGTGITIACDDADACTAGETCLGDADSTCGGSSTIACDDGNPCTAETCDPVNGCLQ